jgi:O-antigen/teichoic acid export membrane protein
MSLVRQAKTGALWGVSTKILNQALSWIVTIWVIRILTPEDFAIIALNDISIGLLLVIGRFGVQGALVKAKELTESQINQTFTWLLVFNAILFLFINISAEPIALYFEKPQLLTLIQVSSFLFIFSPLSTVSVALIYRNMLYKQIAKLDIFINIVQIAANLTLAVSGFGFWALAIGLILAQILRAIGYSYIVKFKPKLDFNFTGMKQLRADSNFSFFTVLAWELQNRVDEFFINHFIGGIALGVYKIGLSLSEKPVSFVGQVIQQVGLSSFSKISEDTNLVGSYVVKATGLVTFISFPVFFGIAALSPSFVPFLLGEKWIDAVIPLQILCMVQLVNIQKEISGSALFAVGQAKQKFIQAFVAFILSSVAWILGLQLGFIEGCISFALTYICWFAWHIFDTGLYIKLTGFWKNQFTNLIMSVCMFLSVLYIDSFMENISIIYRILIQVTAGIMVYIIIGGVFFRRHCISTTKLFLKKQ